MTDCGQREMPASMRRLDNGEAQLFPHIRSFAPSLWTIVQSIVCMPRETPVNIHEETTQSVRVCAMVDSPFYSHRHTGLHSIRLFVTF